MDDTVRGLLVALKYDLRVATHPASHVFSIFPRSSTHDQKFQAVEASNNTAWLWIICGKRYRRLTMPGFS
jgi:hypothetical protein